MAANDVVTAKGPDSLKDWCDKHNFAAQIHQKLVELEFQSPLELTVLPEEDINDLCDKELCIKYGTKARFLNAVKETKIKKEEDDLKQPPAAKNDDNQQKNNNSNARTLRLYQSSNQWKITFYPGTPADEMRKAIRQIAGIKAEHDFLLLDGDGENVILSSHIADDTPLHLEIIKPLPKPADVSGTNEVSFQWDATSRTCSNHVVKDSGMTVGQAENKGWGHTFATLTMQSGTGIYAWSILFNPIQCCIYCSLNDVRAYNIKKMHNQDHDEPVPVFEKTVFNDAFRNGQGFSHGNEKPLEVIYVCDMNKRKLWLFKKGENDKAKVLVNKLPTQVQPFVTLKHVVWISLTGFGKKIIDQNKLNICDTAETVMDAGSTK